MRTTELMLIIVVLALAATITHAATHQVKQDGTGDFTSIQEGIDAAVDGDVVVVHPGTYRENINFGGKNITLRSTDPTDWGVVDATVIDGGLKDSVVTFQGGENESCFLAGFTITNGDSTWGGGIHGGPSYEGPHNKAAPGALSVTTLASKAAVWLFATAQSPTAK